MQKNHQALIDTFTAAAAPASYHTKKQNTNKIRRANWNKKSAHASRSREE